MELIAEHKGLKLIKKYGQYYIRFVGGQYEEYLCDLHITNKEALTIISQNEELKTVRDAYKKQVKWTKDFFVDSGLKDYLFYERGLNEATIEGVLRKLDTHKDIKMEFYEAIMYEDFPKSRVISECNYTAQKLKNSAIEFGKKCRPYNIQYRDIFGYVPCRDDYSCSRDEYFAALLKAVETKSELSTIVPKKIKDSQVPNKRY